MSVYFNPTGTSYPAWRISETGPTIYQGGSIPNNAIGSDGDLYIQTGTGTEQLYQRASGIWTNRSLSSIPSGELIGNSGATSVIPQATTLTSLIDRAIGNVQGDILYRGTSTWSVLAPGTTGQLLETTGASSNPQWTNFSSIIDTNLGSSEGSIAIRGASLWTALTPGTTSQLLQTDGSSSLPVWTTLSLTGTVSGTTSNGTVTTSINLTNGDLFVGNGSNVATARTMSGDAAMSNTGVVTVSKTNGVAFASYATATVGQLAGTSTNDNASAGNVGEFITASTTGNSNTVTITIASPAVVSWASHGLTVGSIVQFSTTGALPTGISTATSYYVITTGLTSNSFQISTTPFGSAVTTTGSQSGTQTATSSVALTTTSISNVVALNLTAGDWDVFSTASFVGTSSTTVTYLISSLSSSTSTLLADGLTGKVTAFLNATTPFTALTSFDQYTGLSRVSIGSTTAMYLNVKPSFGVSTLVGFGTLSARRAR